MAKEFAWDSERMIGQIEVGEKERRIISMCSLSIEREEEEAEERWYVSISTWKFFKKKLETEPYWRAVKNAVIPLALWDEINSMVQSECEEEDEEE